MPGHRWIELNTDMQFEKPVQRLADFYQRSFIVHRQAESRDSGQMAAQRVSAYRFVHNDNGLQRLISFGLAFPWSMARFSSNRLQPSKGVESNTRLSKSS